MIVHVVLLKLKEEITADEVLSFARLLTEACRSMPVVTAAWVGPRVTVDPGYDRSFGDTTYDFAAILQFANRDDLLSYLRHPAHSDVGGRFWEICQATTVFEGELLDLKRVDPTDFGSINQPGQTL
jgi:hypothetical protein